jgi:hypothetical protein
MRIGWNYLPTACKRRSETALSANPTPIPVKLDESNRLFFSLKHYD